MINKIKDSEFDGVIDTYQISYRTNPGGISISGDWIVKQHGGVTATVSNDGSGLQVRGSIDKDTYSYLYIRQTVKGIHWFDGKHGELVVQLSNTSDSAIMYDVYVQARYNADDSDRVLVCDTKSTVLPRGISTIRLPIDTSNLPMAKQANEENGLSVALRINGIDSKFNVTIHSMELQYKEEVKSNNSVISRLIDWLKEMFR